MQVMRVQSLGWEDPLEKEMATLSSILAWKSQRQRGLAAYSRWSHKELDTTYWLKNKKREKKLIRKGIFFQGRNNTISLREARQPTQVIKTQKTATGNYF